MSEYLIYSFSLCTMLDLARYQLKTRVSPATKGYFAKYDKKEVVSSALNSLEKNRKHADLHLRYATRRQNGVPHSAFRNPKTRKIVFREPYRWDYEGVGGSYQDTANNTLVPAFFSRDD